MSSFSATLKKMELQPYDPKNPNHLDHDPEPCHLPGYSPEMYSTDPETGEDLFFFDQVKADIAVKFIEKHILLTRGLTQGPFKLTPHQRNIVRYIFGYRVRKTGKRRYRRALLYIARKNGKTTFTAALLAAFMVLEQWKGRPGYASGAGDREQAGEVYYEAEAMIDAAKRPDSGSVLHKLLKYVSSKKQLVARSGSKYKALVCDNKRLQGGNLEAAFQDETHVLTGVNGRLARTAIRKSLGAAIEPFFMDLTTAHTADNSGPLPDVYKQFKEITQGAAPHRYASRSLPAIFECPAGEKEEWYYELENLRLANPNLDIALDPETLLDEIEDAKASPANFQDFLRYNANVIVDALECYFILSRLDDAETYTEEDCKGPCFAGMDLSQKIDLCSITLFWPETMVMRTWGFLPEKHANAQKYREYEQKNIIFTEGDVIDYNVIERVFKKLDKKYDIEETGFDPYGATQIVNNLLDDGHWMTEVRQGFLSMSEPCKELQSYVVARKLRIHPESGPDRFFKWQFSCSKGKSDEADNDKIVKDKNNDGDKIDGVIAGAMAVAMYMKSEGVLDDLFSSIMDKAEDYDDLGEYADMYGIEVEEDDSSEEDDFDFSEEVDEDDIDEFDFL